MSETNKEIHKGQYAELSSSKKRLYYKQWQRWGKGGWKDCSDQNHEVVGYIRYIYRLKSTTPPEVKAVERRKETVKEGHQLQVMSMNRNGVWDWFTIDTDLQDSALNEVLEKRLPYRIIPIQPFKAVDEGESDKVRLWLNVEKEIRQYDTTKLTELYTLLENVKSLILKS